MTITVDKVKRFAWRLTKKAALVLGALVLLALALVLYAWYELVEPRWSEFGTIPDEAKRANLTRKDMPPAGDEYFVKMDKGWLVKPGSAGENKEGQEWISRIAKLINRSDEEVRQSAIRGQNGWIVWTGGNDRFWDYAANNTSGAFDLLKVLSSYKDKDHPENSMYYGRRNRWRYLGLVNEPCFIEATEPDNSRFGLWLDRRETNDSDCPKDPFADEKKYPGVRIGARGRTVPVGSYYGEPSGIIGLRLFPNPDFNEEAARKWDPVKYYTDPKYFNDPTLVRPYRVGMSCAFCHVGPNPINPPDNPEAPKWENLTSNPGAQYYWVDRIFVWNTRPRDRYTNAPTQNEGNFLFQLFHTNPPGSLDTSLVSTDYMNNPRTMNAVYDTLERLSLARKTGREQLKGGELDNKQFGEYPLTTALSDYWDQRSGRIHTMRVLKDGSDSVGALGALNRVYLNIGLFSEEWLLHFRPFVGGRKITPIRIADAQKQSVYWQATEDMTPDMAVFFLTTSRADKLKDAPKGNDYLKDFNSEIVNRGKVVFAENCAACHSSTNKLPPPPPNSGIDSADCDGGGNGPNYRQCWDRYWQWTQTSDFKQAMVEIVKRDDFLKDNYLSNERRVPLDLLQVNACGLLASNALRGDIWDNFSSDSYKSLPPPAETTIYHPESGAAMPLRVAGNGRGYLRPASLISLWSTAPYLSNNSVGHYDDYGYDYGYSPRCPSDYPDDPYLPCVENRLRQFDRSIHEMLYPERRRMDPIARTPGYMYRTTAPSCLRLDNRALPPAAQKLSGLLHWLVPWAIDETGGVALGPLPKDFPINALLNTKILPDNDETDMFRHLIKLGKAIPTLLDAFKQFGGACKPEQLADPGTQYRVERVVRDTRLIDTLVGISKCPDYVVNRGHYFGAGLPNADKEALIEYLKHF
jgi:hypothetical protein